MKARFIGLVVVLVACRGGETGPSGAAEPTGGFVELAEVSAGVPSGHPGRAPEGAGVEGVGVEAVLAGRGAIEPAAESVRAGRRAIRPAEGSTFHAALVGHDLRARWSARATHVETSSGAPLLRVGLVAWGRSGALSATAPQGRGLGPCQADGATDPEGRCLRRLELDHGALTEWWESRAAGLEHGFTVQGRPGGTGSLRFVLDFGEAEVSLESEAALGLRVGTRSLRYAGLLAWDVDGRGLPVRFEVGSEGPAIVVDDRGARYPVTVDPVLSSPAWTASSEQPGDRFGWAAAPAGDVNGDGYDDVVVGAYRFEGVGTEEGRAYVYFGSASGLGVSAGWTHDGGAADVIFGFSVALAGDVNGDGLADVIVGAPEYSNYAGKATLFLGSHAGLASVPDWEGFRPPQASHFGLSVASAGDVNGDGFGDVVVGAHGAAAVFLGGPAGLDGAPAWTGYSPSGPSFSYGLSVASAGDVNGDGYDDFLVGAPYFNGPEVQEGAAYLYLGSATGPVAAPAWRAESNVAGVWYGDAVSSAGDVNGDGYDDVIIGAPLFPDTASNQAGRAFLYLGSASGLSSTPAWVGMPDVSPARFGNSVAAAGDLNGDGFDDVLVGVPVRNEVHLYAGTPGGLSAAPIWIGRVAGQSLLGWTVAAAGDVNGDGVTDVLVGAGSRGAALVFLGVCEDDDHDAVCTVNDVCPAVADPAQLDADGDGLGDACDACPLDADNDADEDGACGDVDVCPAVPDADQLDADGDGQGDACDACPLDPANDSDADGVCGDVDVCPAVADPAQLDADGDGRGDACDACPFDVENDADADGVCGDVDVCPAVADPAQLDADGDGRGDACDACLFDADNDADADGVCGDVDVCPAVPDADQLDADGDGQGDACDACPLDPDDDSDADSVCGDVDVCPDVADPAQLDADGDGQGDACDACPLDAENDADADGACGDVDVCPALPDADQLDADGDGQGDACDPCPLDAENDADEDGVCGDVDVCPAVPDADQLDADRDGQGDACDPCPLDADDDSDADGVCGDVDICPAVADPAQLDADGDGQGDACDACPLDADNDADADGACGDVDVCPAVPDPDQLDADGDGQGDACDACPLDAENDVDADGVCGDVDVCPTVPDPDQLDADGDGRGDACDACPLDAENDADADGLCASEDLCPDVADPQQADADGDGVGDACDNCPAWPNPDQAPGSCGEEDGQGAHVGGCGCAASGGGASWLAWLALAALVARRRRPSRSRTRRYEIVPPSPVPSRRGRRP